MRRVHPSPQEILVAPARGAELSVEWFGSRETLFASPNGGSSGSGEERRGMLWKRDSNQNSFRSSGGILLSRLHNLFLQCRRGNAVSL